jgi:RND family efflux transporter MFP subunit
MTILPSCKNENGQDVHLNFKKPKVSGNKVIFEDDSTASYFISQPIGSSNLQSEFSAPARVVATVISSSETPEQKLILFDNPNLTSSYTLLLQYLANVRQTEQVVIKQRAIELERLLDLQTHGSATGQDVLKAQTALAQERVNLVNQKTDLLKHETLLRLSGFNTRILRNARSGTVWVISEIPDNQISKVKLGEQCQLVFSSFENETFKGKIEDVGNVVDNVTRLIKLRIEIVNPDRRLKAGMFGSTNFRLEEGKSLSVPLEAVVTMQGKHYVFVKESDLIFECRAVSLGQQANNRMIVFNGLKENEMVVLKGTEQLKGLVFGY